MPVTVWRYIPPLVLPGKLQMVLDRWLFDQYLDIGPCLRFYTWEPAAISLGYHQRHYPEHWTTLSWRGDPLDVVHRATGGRAVLHQGDLTYSLVTTCSGRSRRLAYEYLCQFLIQGWQDLGIPLSMGPYRFKTAMNSAIPSRSLGMKPNCFAMATAADLVTMGGHKLIGSAQLWRGERVLQHGSMQLFPDPDLWQQVFGEPLPPVNLALPAMEPLMNALKKAAIDTWAIALEEKSITAAEWQAIHRYALMPELVEQNQS